MRSWRRPGSVAAIAAALIAAAPAPAPAVSPTPQPSAARLQGFFRFEGHVTQAVNVPGERVGQPVRRVWALISSCRTGACPTVKLVRQRATGFDVLILRRRAPAFYVGDGTYFAPELCHGIRYRKGERVTFAVTLRVTAAALDGMTVVATRLRGFYSSVSRMGLTRCVSPPARDAARYLGVPLTGAPTGASFSEARTRLTAAS
jgi:hypothetical protein